MGRKRGKNYFLEQEMIDLLIQYKKTKDEKIYRKLHDGFTKIINGMINKQFSYNTYVLNNRNDAISECYLNILKSIRNYDVEKGRLFAYINRIVKNTLTLYSKNTKKYKEKESSYSEINDETENSNTAEDNVNNISIHTDSVVDNSIISINSDTADNTINIVPELKNTTIKCSSSIYIIYKYIRYVYEATQFFINNEEYMKKLCVNIKYDSFVEFEFEESYNPIAMNRDKMYENIIYSIDKSVYNIIQWLEIDYSKEINTEPESYNGKLSNRAIGYIRKFVNTKLKRQTGLKMYDIGEITKFIEYLMYKKIEYTEE